MKKNLFALLSIATIVIAGCTDVEPVKIDADSRVSEEWSPVEQAFNKQVDETQYIQDLEDFISYNILSITEDKPYTSDFSFVAEFDEKSTIQWWIEFTHEKTSKTHDLESSEVEFDVKAEEKGKVEPFNLSWSLTLLYKGNDMYANLHRFGLYMWEWNMTAKMYSLLWDLVIDKRVDMEAQNGWIIEVNEDEDKKLPYTVWTLKNILETKNIQSSPDFLNSVAEMIETINSHIDLWISTNELTLLTQEIEYSELWDEIIQKDFVWSFKWKDSSFDLSFAASKKWLEAHIYNIKEYDEDIQDYKDSNSEFLLSIQEEKNSEYSVIFQSIKYQQKVADIQWEIKYADTMKFSADFVLEPLELISGQKISWDIKWNITKKSWEWNKEFPEVTGDIVLLSEILSSL